MVNDTNLLSWVSSYKSDEKYSRWNNRVTVHTDGTKCGGVFPCSRHMTGADREETGKTPLWLLNL